jgi:hypothetical protein
MGKSTTSCNDILALLFNATALPGAYTGNLYIALHSSTPGIGGVQTSNEVVYTSYDRVLVVRTAGGWTVSGAAVSNAAQIAFPTCTGLTDTARFVSIGTDAFPTGGRILYFGELNSPLAISNNITPQFALGALQITEA